MKNKNNIWTKREETFSSLMYMESGDERFIKDIKPRTFNLKGFLPFMISTRGELICIPAEHDMPSVGIFGCLAGDTEVIVDNKFVPIKDIKKGKVLSYSKKGMRSGKIIDSFVSSHSQAYKIKIKEDVKSIKTVVCSGNHNFITFKNGRESITKAKDLRVKDLVPFLKNNPSISYYKKYLGFDLTYDLGWLSGLYLAEGHINSLVCFTNYAKPIQDKLIKILKNINFDFSLYYDGNRIKSINVKQSKTLRNFLLPLFGQGSKTKFIHNKVFKFPKEFKKGLVAGYISGDGYCKQKWGFTSISKDLIDGMRILLLQFGVYTSFKIDNSSYVKNNKKIFTGNKRYSCVIRKPLFLKDFGIVKPYKPIFGIKYKTNYFQDIERDIMTYNYFSIYESKFHKGNHSKEILSILEETKQIKKIDKSFTTHCKTRYPTFELILVDEFKSFKSTIQKRIINYLRNGNKTNAFIKRKLVPQGFHVRNIGRAIRTMRKKGTIKKGKLIYETQNVSRSCTLKNLKYFYKINKHNQSNVKWRRIVSIEKISNSEPLYDITIDKYHNFTLGNGFIIGNSKRGGKTNILANFLFASYWHMDWNLAHINDMTRETFVWHKRMKSKPIVEGYSDFRKPKALPLVHVLLASKDLRMPPRGTPKWEVCIPFMDVVDNPEDFLDMDGKAASLHYLSGLRKHFLKYRNNLTLEIVEKVITKHLDEKFVNPILVRIRRLYKDGILDICKQNSRDDIHVYVKFKDTNQWVKFNTLPGIIASGGIPIVHTDNVIDNQRFCKKYLTNLLQKLVTDQESHPFFKTSKLAIFIDEITTLSFKGLGGDNPIIYKLVAQGGPKGIGTFYATQNPSLLDRRILANTKYFVTCQNVKSEAKILTEEFGLSNKYADTIVGLDKNYRECLACTSERFAVFNPYTNQLSWDKGPFKGEYCMPGSNTVPPKSE